MNLITVPFYLSRLYATPVVEPLPLGFSGHLIIGGRPETLQMDAWNEKGFSSK